ncbi:PLP-dependent transferase [Breoghania sp.]|uniref:PLP-dependent transferase n=1 Tax=Breoghania sp. TaxID=2065378 RepID=UPI00260A5980|nr:PLP-dependent transferase [Breoghania sp.]MDJ0931355.1 PLP-dependent transferase [Breoghania sp.]
MNGHSDLLAGVVSTCDASSEHWRLICKERHDAGAVLGSFEAWLLVRGLRTLSLRVERMNANALAVAQFLEGHAKVETVLYPGLATHPGHEIAIKQMTGGFGSLVSVLIKGGREEALAVFCRASSDLPACDVAERRGEPRGAPLFHRG